MTFSIVQFLLLGFHFLFLAFRFQFLIHYIDISTEDKCSYIIAIHLTTCNICNMGRSNLPDMYTQARGHAAPENGCGHIRQITTAYVTYVM